MYRLKISGNFFLILNDSDLTEHSRHPSKDVRFQIYDELGADPILSLLGLCGQFNTKNHEEDNFLFSQLLDDSGVAFTDLDALKTFLDDELGKSSPVIDGASLVGTGWGQYGDSQYTLLTPLVASGSSTVIIDLDGLSNTIKPQLPGGQELYDANTSKITPVSSGDAYSLSIQFSGSNTSNNGDATLFIDIGGSFTRLFPKTFRFNRGAGVSHEYYFTFKMYSLDTFLANGGLIKLQSGTGTTSIYDIIIQIHRTHKAI